MKAPRKRRTYSAGRMDGVLRDVLPIVEAIIGMAVVAVLVSGDDPQGARVRSPARMALAREEQRRRLLAA